MKYLCCNDQTNWWGCVHQNDCSALTSRQFVIIWWINQVVANPTSVGHFRRPSLPWFVAAFWFWMSCICAYGHDLPLRRNYLFSQSRAENIKSEQSQSWDHRRALLPRLHGSHRALTHSPIQRNGPGTAVRWWHHRHGAAGGCLPAFVFLLVWLKERLTVIRASWL